MGRFVEPRTVELSAADCAQPWTVEDRSSLAGIDQGRLASRAQVDHVPMVVPSVAPVNRLTANPVDVGVHVHLSMSQRCP